jgi:bacteriochlorophyllide a dehydrogenase
MKGKNMKANAVIFESASKVAVRSVSLPGLRDGDILIETEYSTISPGTELRTLAGKEQTAAPFPLIPGYSTVGRIVAFGSDVKGLTEGMKVFVRSCRVLEDGLGCSWGGHSSHLIADQGQILVLPEKADPQKATLIALLATAVHGVDLSKVRIREQVAVVGLGLVGQLCARLLHYCGANVVATDMIEHRRQIARQAGITTVDFQPDLRTAFAAHFPCGAEVVLDATGSSKALKGSLSLLRGRSTQDGYGAGADEQATGPAGEKSVFEKLQEKSHYENSWHGPRLIAQGSYADPIVINYYDLFNNEVGFVVPRVHETKDAFRALELLVDPDFNLDGLHTQTRSVSEAPSVYQELQENPAGRITVCFDWNLA